MACDRPSTRRGDSSYAATGIRSRTKAHRQFPDSVRPWLRTMFWWLATDSRQGSVEFTRGSTNETVEEGRPI
jgi:hypothetical protein